MAVRDVSRAVRGVVSKLYRGFGDVMQPRIASIESLEDRRLFTLWAIQILDGGTALQGNAAHANTGSFTVAFQSQYISTGALSGTIDRPDNETAGDVLNAVLDADINTSYDLYPNYVVDADVHFIQAKNLLTNKGISSTQWIAGLDDNDPNYFDDEDYNDAYVRLEIKPVEAPCCIPCGNCNQASDGPVGYSDGQPRYTTTDLDSSGFGEDWSQSRSWTTSPEGQISNTGAGFVGTSVSSAIQLGTSYKIMNGGHSYVLFSPSGSDYVAQFGALSKLQVAGTGSSSELVMTDPDGTVTHYFGFDSAIPAAKQGLLKSRLDPAGNPTDTVYDSGTNLLTQISRSIGSGSTQQQEAFDYTYYTSGVNAGLVSSVIQRQKIGSGSWEDVRSVECVYYDGSNARGNARQLERAIIHDGGLSADVLDTKYYRYYAPQTITSISRGNYGSSGATATATVGSHEFLVGQTINVTGAPGAYSGSFVITAVTSTTISYKINGAASDTPSSYSGSGMGVTAGVKGALKLVFENQSYDRLAANVSSPLTATDAAILPYANYYFEYDSMGRVVKEIAQAAGCSTCGNGQGTYTFAYAESSFANGFNTWKTQTIETLPDGNQNIVFTNAFGQVMGKNLKEVATNTWWRDYYRFDSEGREILHANPSAVKGFSPTYADLVIYNTGTGNATWLENSKGLIELTNYASTTTATSTTPGDVAGYVKSTSIKRGTGTTAVPQSSTSYISHTDPDGNTIYKVASETRYRNTDGTGGQTTTYAYTWILDGSSSETNQVATQTVTMPTVTSAQNGPGTAQTETTYFDAYGRAIWTVDGEGYITYSVYDQKTGSMLQQITDADPTLITDAPVAGPTRSSSLPTALHLSTAMEVDTLGRTTKTTDANGHVTYTVYNDSAHETRTYRGWNATTGTTTGPIEVWREDRPGSYTESLTMSATPATSGSSGSYEPTGTEAIANLESLSRTYTSTAGQVVESRSYFNLTGLTYSTAASLGTAGVNYYATTYAYDNRGRQKRTIAPTGTITWTVYDTPGRVKSTWVGTNDTGAVNGDPTGGGASGNNMQKVVEYQYDGGLVGDGNLTKMTQIPGGSAVNRVSEMYYDWRDRMVASKAAKETTESTSDNTHFISYTDYDNLNQATASYVYDGDNVTVTSTNSVPNKPSASLLRAKSTTAFDEQGRAYRSTTFSVDPSNGTVSSTGLVTDTFYDLRGDVIESKSTAQAVQKMTYDGAGRMSKSFTTDGGGDTGWSDADDVIGDVVLEQGETQYDADGNVILGVTRQRFHDATATGELGDPSSTTVAKARVSYTAMYYDAADRMTDAVNVGTNGGTAYTRPGSVPSRSDTTLVSSYSYDSAGRLFSRTDPRGIESRTYYDALSRTTKTISNYVDGSPSNDDDQTTSYTYDGSGHVLTLKAELPSSTFQETQYVYGASSSRGDLINSNDVLIATRYPNKSTGSASTGEEETYLSNALGERIDYVDRNLTRHDYTYDVLGRQTADIVTTLGTGVDGAVRRLGTEFDTQGNAFRFTSYDAATGGSVVNQVQRAFNGLGQLTTEYQATSGSVNTSSTPKVQYGYDTLANGSRMNSMTYPNGRVLNYNYASGLDSTISRLSSITDSSTTLESYSYLGAGTVVARNHPESGINLTYIGTGPGDGGDQYVGLDRFGRVVDQNWTNGTTSVDQYQYGYDRDGNVLYKNNTVSSSNSELYAYDSLNRLTNMQRGTLDGTKTGLTGSATRSQDWSLDALGNSNTVTIDGTAESRTHNRQNELTQMGSSSLTFDLNGNTTIDQTGKTLVYDPWNRLIEVKNGSTSLIRYERDALSRQIEEGNAILYYSAGWQVLEERNSSGQATHQYVWSPVYVDAAVARDRDTDANGTLDERVYFQQDANFNVISLSDTTGVTVERYLTDSYGKQIVLDANWSIDGDGLSDVNNRQGHQGGFHDRVVTYHIDFRNRFLDVDAMRWGQPDPMGYADGINTFAVEHYSPTNRLDPQGLADGEFDMSNPDHWYSDPTEIRREYERQEEMRRREESRKPFIWDRSTVGAGSLGAEFIIDTSNGNKHFDFGPNDYFTKEMRGTDAAKTAAADAKLRACEICEGTQTLKTGNWSYSPGLGTYILDYSAQRIWWSVPSFVGGYLGKWEITALDCKMATATVEFSASNTSGLYSLTKVPIPFADVHLLNNRDNSRGSFSNVYQTWKYTEEMNLPCLSCSPGSAPRYVGRYPTMD